MGKTGIINIAGYIIGGLILGIAIIFVVNMREKDLDFKQIAIEISNNMEKSDGEKIINEPVTALEISNIAGSIKILPSENKNLVIKYRKHGTNQKELDALGPDIELSGTKLSVKRSKIILKNSRGFISFEIYLPQAAETLKITTVSGSIFVDDLGQGMDQELHSVSGSIETLNSHNFEANSVSGSIDFEAKGNSIEASTTSGSIKGDITSSQSTQVSLNSISGSIDLDIGDNSNFQIDLSSLSGQLKADPEPRQLKQKRGSLKGIYGSGSASLEASTVSGSIKITD